MQSQQRSFVFDEEKSMYVSEAVTEHKYTLIWIHGMGQDPQKHFHFFTSDRLPLNCKIVMPLHYRNFSFQDGKQNLGWYDRFHSEPCPTNELLYARYSQPEIDDSLNKISQMISNEVSLV